MRITARQLRQIIREELLRETYFPKVSSVGAVQSALNAALIVNGEPVLPPLDIDNQWGGATETAWDAFVEMFYKPADFKKDGADGPSIAEVQADWIAVAPGMGYSGDPGGALEFINDVIAKHPAATPPVVSRPASRSKLKGYIIGDSISVGPFGIELEKELKRTGCDVFRAAVGGSAASGWVIDKPFGRSGELTSVISNGPYDFGIICLGTNDSANAERAVSESLGKVTMPTLTAAFARNINSIAQKVGAPINFWVGPPALAGSGNTKWWVRSAADAMYAAALPTFTGDTYDSRWVTPGSDGVHVYGAAASQWAADVAQNVSNRLL